jgi:hypothetical protein
MPGGRMPGTGVPHLPGHDGRRAGVHADALQPRLPCWVPGTVVVPAAHVSDVPPRAASRAIRQPATSGGAPAPQGEGVLRCDRQDAGLRQRLVPQGGRGAIIVTVASLIWGS